MIGTTIAHYKITGKLGEGGMGEVYRATDTKLNREVALKILPEQFAADEQRMGRFEREAQVLASLNHPHIGGIHGIEDVGATKTLVLELIEGPTLKERIDQGRIPVEDVIGIAVQMTDALEAAHEKGIVHRDLKPANIKVTPEGQVKVLDFGLAKAVEPTSGISSPDMTQSPTLTVAATQAGIILGTAAYMSPEQAAGQPVDKRADIWAFGVVLFEMLTSQPLFSGETVSHTMADVLRADIDFDKLPQTTPLRLRQLLGRCLQRDLKKRLRDIGDARHDLEEALNEPTPAPRTVTRTSALPWAAAVVTAVAGVWLGSLWQAPAPPIPVRKSTIELANPSLRWTGPQLSPDGSMLAYSDRDRLYVRRLDELEPREIHEDIWQGLVEWSPDSRFVAFLADGKLWKFEIGGNEPVYICDWDERTIGLAWGADDRIVISKWREGLYRVSANGGQPELWIDVDETDVDFHSPMFLPDGRTLLAGVHPVPEAEGGLAAFSDSGKQMLPDTEIRGFAFSYSGSGHLLSGTGDNIWATPFDPETLGSSGEPFLVAPGTMPSASSDGSLAYAVREGGDRSTQLVWIDREGQIVGTAGDQRPFHRNHTLSPDGTRVAVLAGDGENDLDIWVYEVERAGAAFRLTSLDGDPRGIAWSPDGNSIVFSNGEIPPTLLRIPAGGGEAVPLTSGAQANFSPDGRYLIFTVADVRGTYHLAYLDLEAEGAEPVGLFESGDGKMRTVGTFSPDGRFVAYASDESGRFEIYVRSFPDGARRLQVSVEGSNGRPVWSADGNKLYYVHTRSIREAELDLGSTPRVLDTREAIDFSELDIRGVENFGVSADGLRFLMNQSASQGNRRSRRVNVVQNWFGEFEER